MFKKGLTFLTLVLFLVVTDGLTQEKKMPGVEDAKFYFLKCQKSLEAGDVDDAIKYGEQAVALDNRNSEYFFQLGVIYNVKINKVEMMEKMEYANKMLEVWKKSVELNPKHIRARNGLIQFYLNAPPFAGGSIKEAKKQAEEIAKYDDMAGYSALAQIYLKENNLEQAKDTALKAYQLHMEFKKKNQKTASSFNVNILNTLGYGLLNAKKTNEAIEIFKKNVLAYPKYFNSYDSLAETYMNAGETKLAVEYYEKALALNPNKNNFEKRAYVNQQKYLKKLKASQRED